MMWEPEVPPRELQNHLLQVRHLTTLLGEWIPQYLVTHKLQVKEICRQVDIASKMSVGLVMGDLRTSPVWQLCVMLIQSLKILLIAIRTNPAMASGGKSNNTGSVVAIHDRKGVVVVDGGVVPVVGQTRRGNRGGIVIEVGR
jgi:hypothetical protein